jgi:hypothetical protein
VVDRLKVTVEVYQAMERIQNERYAKKILALPDNLNHFEKERRIAEYIRLKQDIMSEFEVV